MLTTLRNHQGSTMKIVICAGQVGGGGLNAVT
jgi:hypothetical protein